MNNLFRDVFDMGPPRFTHSMIVGYEVSSAGDPRFSALFAKITDHRTIEQWYQCDIKGYDVRGFDWRLGKGKPSLIDWNGDQQWELYLSVWRLWAVQNAVLMYELKEKAIAHDYTLRDRFATTNINQARALATILNEWFT